MYVPSCSAPGGEVMLPPYGHDTQLFSNQAALQPFKCLPRARKEAAAGSKHLQRSDVSLLCYTAGRRLTSSDRLWKRFEANAAF